MAKEQSNLPGVFTAKKKDGTIYYRASLTFKRRHISLGSFSCADDASRAYKEGQRFYLLPLPYWNIQVMLPFLLKNGLSSSIFGIMVFILRHQSMPDLRCSTTISHHLRF